MASMWRKAMLYLGLGPDDEYDDFDVTGEHQRPVTPRPAARRTGAGEAQHDPEPLRRGAHADPVRGRRREERGTATAAPATTPRGRAPSTAARRTAPRPAGRPRPPAAGRVRPVVPRSGRGGAPSPGRPVQAFRRRPTSFNDAQEVADKFKVNVPVILNLQGVERDLARRIIDFASGLCYGLGGQMERVATQVYLLTPSDVEVSPEERRRLRERGYEA